MLSSSIENFPLDDGGRGPIPSLHRIVQVAWRGNGGARGAEFTMPPTDVTAARIAMLNDAYGNLIQVTQLKRW